MAEYKRASGESSCARSGEADRSSGAAAAATMLRSCSGIARARYLGCFVCVRVRLKELGRNRRSPDQIRPCAATLKKSIYACVVLKRYRGRSGGSVAELLLQLGHLQTQLVDTLQGARKLVRHGFRALAAGRR